MLRLLVFFALTVISSGTYATPQPAVIWSSPFPRVLSAGIRFGSTDAATVCNAAAAGSIRYNSGVFEFCDSSSWASAALLSSGTVPLTKGGTGQTSANAAFNALAPAQTSASGKYLTSDGTNTSWGTIASGAALSALTAATQANTIDNLNFAQVWNNSSITSQNGYTFAATAGSVLTGDLVKITQTVGSGSVTGNLLDLVNTGNSTQTKNLNISNSSGDSAARGIVVAMSNSGGGHKAIEVTDSTGSSNAVGLSVTMSSASLPSTGNAIFATTASTNGAVGLTITATGATGSGFAASFDNASANSGATGVRITQSSATAAGKALSVVHNGTSGYVGDFNGTATGVRDIIRLQNSVAAATSSEARLTFSANRTTGGLTDVSGISGIITDIGNASYKGAVVIYTADNAAMSERMRIDYAGHVLFTGTAPSITANCGSSPSIAGNDSAGRLTVGTGGTAVNCTITFAKAWTNAPVCIAADENTSLVLTGISTTTTFSITAATPYSAADKLIYHCVGY